MNKLKEINGKYYQECEVVMLATDNKAAPILSYLNNKSLQYFPNTYWSNSSLSKRHLYITSDEEIKEGDWVTGATGSVIQCMHPKMIIHRDIKKIIATTDTSLGLPQPSSQFILKYIELYNAGTPIKWVNVEFEEYATKTTYYSDIDCSIPLFRLKVNSSNEITIKKIKDIYTREKVIELLSKHFVEAGSKIGLGQNVTEFTKIWIEENL